MTAPPVDITHTCAPDADAGGVEWAIRLARSLPEYFTPAGLETLRRDIAHGADVYLAWRNDDAIAFAVVQHGTPGVAELAWIGVARDHRRHGLGRTLMARIVRDLGARGVLLLSTRTLAATVEYAPYDAARAFFETIGFLHVETIDPYPGWDAGNPCALLVLPIRRDPPA